jgi:hypothetical protein
MEWPGADSEEKREPASDIDTEAADSLKALDPKRPIIEADMAGLAAGPGRELTLSRRVSVILFLVYRRGSSGDFATKWRL